MIEVNTAGDGDILDILMSGEVSREDYETALVPAVEAALAQHARVRMVVEFTALFEKFDLEAAWTDMELGLSHWSGFDRLAVIADQGWIRNSIRLAGPILPCPVKVFALDERAEAKRWIRESLGSVHVEPIPGGGIEVQLMGQLDPDMIERAEETLDALIRTQGSFRLMLNLTMFEGWQGLSAIGRHVKLVRDHAPLAQKVAVLGDKPWQNVARSVAGRVLSAETQSFGAGDRDAAIAWLQS